MSAPIVSLRSGSLQLGKLLGKGGEGAVYEVVGKSDHVAKIYLREIATDRVEKLRAMQSITSAQLRALSAWPSELIYSPSGNVAGFLMANMRGTKDVHALYSPKSRLNEFPQADWRMLVRAALNTAKAFAALHETGNLVGDVNHGGIRVAADATVKLIDCDSFQITLAGRTYLCEVGVDNFTPPELQGKSFKSTRRTEDHDNFGLAVLIFQLLMMGRHPYAGRYSGNEDMPIPKAIGQFRYAYARDRASTGMHPPPNTAPIGIASQDVADLWEHAFGRDGATRGRPKAMQWIDSLSRIERSFIKCRSNSAHYYLAHVATCPWCAIEKVGITLFVPGSSAAVMAASKFSLDQIWSQITSIQHPGPAPQLPGLPIVVPSVAASEVRRIQRTRSHAGWAIGTLFFIAATVIRIEFGPLWAALGFTLGRFIAERNGGDDLALALLQTHERAKSTYDGLVARWQREVSVSEFDRQLENLKRLRALWLDLPTERQRRHDALMKDGRAKALQTFLDGFDIESASIPGVGPAKKAMLESFGIETAADVVESAVLQVPGFGPALTQRLITWRRDQERNFRFDPTRGLDKRTLADLDREMGIKRLDIEQKLLKGATALRQLSSLMAAKQRNLMGAIIEAGQGLAQASTDLKAIA